MKTLLLQITHSRFPKYFLLLLLNVALTHTLHTQIIIDTTVSPEDLANSLVGYGIEISNVDLECAEGAFGYFERNGSNIGLREGIVLTSGSAKNAIGPNNDGGITTNNSTAGNVLLNGLAGGVTHDACKLSFDLSSITDTIRFRYVFASDEYPEYVGTPFNDVFGFFIDGPGLSNQNIAFIPGGTTPVTINNVNGGINDSYYIDNGDGNDLFPSTDSSEVQYDGLTTTMIAKVGVVPCETYRLHMIVADVDDPNLDSAVFVEAESLVAFPITAFATTELALAGYPQFDYGIEGCNDIIVKFQRGSSVRKDSLWLKLAIGGTAQNGVDYDWIPDSVYFEPNLKTTELVISPLTDNLLEGTESLSFTILSEYDCVQTVDTSLVMYIHDDLGLAGPSDTVPACFLTPVELTLNINENCTWSPATYLDDSTSCTPISTPFEDITYQAVAQVGACIDTTSINIKIVGDGDFGLRDTTLYVCQGDSVGLLYSNPQVETYLITPANTSSCANCPNPYFLPDSTQVYQVIAANVVCEQMAIVTVVVESNPPIPMETVEACETVMTTIGTQALEGYTYSWSPATGLNMSNMAQVELTITADQAPFYQVYTLTSTNPLGCSRIDELVVNVEMPISEAYIATPDSSTNGSPVELSIVNLPEGASVQWQASSNLSLDTNNTVAIVTPLEVTDFFAEILSSNGTCSSTISTTVYTNTAVLFVPTAFSPNNDNLNDNLRVHHRLVEELISFRVFNRWGETLFETQDLNDTWDGTHRFRPQEIGIYPYLVEYREINNEEIKQVKGYVALVR